LASGASRARVEAAGEVMSMRGAEAALVAWLDGVLRRSGDQ